MVSFSAVLLPGIDEPDSTVKAVLGGVKGGDFIDTSCVQFWITDGLHRFRASMKLAEAKPDPRQVIFKRCFVTLRFP